MSYIHQALKKAQTERDGRYGKYHGILSSRKKASGFVKRSTLLIIVSLVILFLAFIAYSWLDFSDPQTGTEVLPKPKKSDRPPIQKKSADADLFFQRGKAHHKNGRFSEAKIWYDKALSADPGCVVALNNLGVLLIHERNYPAARSTLEKAIRLKPGYVDPYYNLACFYALTNQPEEGLRYLKRAVSIDPQVKEWAMEDADLEKLRDQPGFGNIVD